MIIPAILENSIFEVQAKINQVKVLVNRVQVDIVDGIFADNLTVSPVDLLNIDFAGLAVDIHLMTEEPVDFLEESADLVGKCGAVRVIGQVERMGKQSGFVKLARELKLEVGLALDFYTPVSAINNKVIESLDCALLMAVMAGTQGNKKFSPAVIDKIGDINKGLSLHGKDSPFQIIVDGGLDPASVRLCRRAGADQFAVGSWLWQHKDIKLALGELT